MGLADLRTLPSMLAAALAALAVTGCPKEDAGFVVSGRVEKDRVRVGSKLGGRVSKVLHDEGDAIVSSGIVVELERADFEADLAYATAREAEAQAQLDLLVAGSRKEDVRRAEAVVAARRSELELRRKGFRPEEVLEAEAQLAQARSRYELAARDLERSRSLQTQGVSDAGKLDAAQSAAETARASVDIALQRLRLVQSGSRPEEIAVAEAQLAQAVAEHERLRNGARPEEIAAARASWEAAGANRDRIRSQLAETEIRAPEDCAVETLDLKPGDLVRAGQTVATLELRKSPWVRGYVPESRLGLVRPGLEVQVTVDSLPGQTFAGVVRKISAEAEFTPRNVQTAEKRAELVFELKVDVQDPQARLRAGMYADVHVARERP